MSDKSMIEEFLAKNKITVCEDGWQDNTPSLAKYKTGYRDRIKKIAQIFDDCFITYKGVKFRLESMFDTRAKNHGIIYKMIPATGALQIAENTITRREISEAAIKTGITKGRITLLKDEKCKEQ